MLGYGLFFPITLVAKGSEGLVAGAIGKTKNAQVWIKGVGIALGGVCMVTSYFLGEWLYFGVGVAIAEIPINIAQVSIGGTIALAIWYPVSAFLQKSRVLGH